VIILNIPEATPSANKFHGHHWTKKLKELKKWRLWAKVEKSVLRKESWFFPENQPPAKCHVTIERYGARLLDRDNFIAGTKWLMDSLVLEGFLAGDSPAHVFAEYHQFVGMPHRTIIRIEREESWRSSAKQQPSSASKVSATKTQSASESAVAIAETCL
jgi:hypothetical protein